MMWESETSSSLLGDERLKSLKDLSIFKCTSVPVCAVPCAHECIYVCVLVLMHLCGECLSACCVCYNGETLANNKMFL